MAGGPRWGLRTELKLGFNVNGDSVTVTAWVEHPGGAAVMLVGSFHPDEAVELAKEFLQVALEARKKGPR